MFETFDSIEQAINNGTTQMGLFIYLFQCMVLYTEIVILLFDYCVDVYSAMNMIYIQNKIAYNINCEDFETSLRFNC